MAIINIGRKNKAEVLAALYNASLPNSVFNLYFFSTTPMTVEEAQRILDEGYTYFDYLKGRVMKIDLSGDEVDTRLYDRDNGEGAGERAIASVPDIE